MCDQLTINPHFSDGWFLPVFYLIYSYQCIAGIQNFFEQAPIVQPGKGKSYWKEQTRQAKEMFSSWEAYYYYIELDDPPDSSEGEGSQVSTPVIEELSWSQNLIKENKIWRWA